MILLAEIPVSPNATDPTSWGSMIEKVGVPMGCLLLFVLPAAVFTFYILRWAFGPSGFIRDGFTRWVDAQVAAFNGIRVDIDELKGGASKEVEEHEKQRAAHQATLSAARHGLNVLDRIGTKVGADVTGEILAAHESLDKS